MTGQTLTANRLDIADQMDYCPKHGTDSRKEYDFGRYADATVLVYKGCLCASCFVNNGFNEAGIRYNDYNTAAGKARMVVQQAKTW